MLSSLPFSSASRAIAVGVALAGASWLTQAANMYAPDSKTLTVPVVNVPGLGSFDAQLVSTGANALPQAGTVFKLTRLVSSREPSSQPAGYLFSDETVMLPAVAVRSPDGTISYFDIKLRNISGASADTFVVDSIQDTILGRPGGAAGPKGEKGDKGETGERGVQGPAGTAGAPGVAGPQGIAGKDGAAGPAGTNGINGLNGKTLLSGNADPLTGDGSDGDFYLNRVTNTLFGPKTANAWPGSGTSLKGPAGAQGVQGETGPKGDTGAVGPAGAKGDTGPQGPQGAKGDTGAVGPAGAKGDTGAQGPQGAKGDTGAVGPAGAKGDTGVQGLQGPIGPQGPKGDSASSQTVHGCFSGAAASASGTGYTATRTNNSYSLSFTGLTMSNTNYTLLIDARTSTGRAWAIGAVKVTNGMTLTGGWLDSAETLGQICFFAAE
ncbi:MAG: hypothetical protein ACWA6Y_07515 [Polaromonas sp.]